LANAAGGEVWVGVDDDGRVVGVTLGRESLRDWSNQIAQALGIHVRMEIYEVKDNTLVRIVVPESQSKPVRYRGRPYVRSGASDRIASEEEVTRWVLDRVGATWDGLPEPRARWEDLDPRQLERFRQLCNRQGRRAIPAEESDETVLRKLGLVTEEGHVSRAAVLLFAQDPQRFYPHAFVRIGRFRSPTFVADDHPIYGTIWDQAEGAMAHFRRHLQTGYGPTPEPAREVIWEYPLEALREAIINAVCHRDYIDHGHVQVRWFDDHMVVVSPGTLPPPLRLEDLKRPHRSYPRNRKIAEMFYYAGWIEQWGSGIEKILEECRDVGLPEHEWREDQGAGWLTFRRGVLTEEHLGSLGLNERQIRAVIWVKEKGRITNAEYQVLFRTSRETAKRELSALAALGLLVRKGAGRSVSYELGQTGQKWVINGSKTPERGSGNAP